MSSSYVIRSRQTCRRTADEPVRRPRGEPALLRPPLLLGLQDDRRLHHREGRRVGRGLGAPRLAEDALHLGERREDPVLRLEELRGLGDGDAGERRRHVEDRPLVERGHELRPEGEVDRHGRGEDEERGRDDLLRVAKDAAADRVVEPEEDLRDGVLLLGVVRPDGDRVDDLLGEPGGEADEPRQESPLPVREAEPERVHPREEHPHRRVERDGEDGRDGHREVLRPGERREEAPLLVDEREDREERDGDDEEREEDRRADLHQRLEADGVEVPLPSPSRSRSGASCRRSPPRRSRRRRGRRWRSRCRRAT